MQPTERVTASHVASLIELADQLQDVHVASQNLLFTAEACSMCKNIEPTTPLQSLPLFSTDMVSICELHILDKFKDNLKFHSFKPHMN